MDPGFTSLTEAKPGPSRKSRSEYRQRTSLASPHSVRFSTLLRSDKHLGILYTVSPGPYMTYGTTLPQDRSKQQKQDNLTPADCREDGDRRCGEHWETLRAGILWAAGFPAISLR